MWPFKSKAKGKKNQELTPEEKSRILREQAIQNAKAARERIGQEALDEVSKAIQRMEDRKKNDISSKAKNLIDQEGSDRAASHVRGLMADKD